MLLFTKKPCFLKPDGCLIRRDAQKKSLGISRELRPLRSCDDYADVILQSQSPRFSLSASISTLARLLVIPVLAYLALTAIGQSSDLRKMTVLALGLAAALMQVILSTRYGCDEEENASVLLYSNVLSIPSLAFLIWLTQ